MAKAANAGNTDLIKTNGIISLDLSPECTENCPLYDTCTYVKSGKCKVHRKYLNDIYKVLQNDVDLLKNDIDKVRFGIHIIPLYSQLLQFKMLESTLSMENMMYKGKIHPIYKEIREVIKALDSMMKSLGLIIHSGGAIPGDSRGKPGDGMGDRSYYDKIMNSEA